MSPAAAKNKSKREREINFATVVLLIVLIESLLLLSLCYVIQTSILGPARRLTEYSLTGIVVSVNQNPNQVIVEDYAGNPWIFYGSEDWAEGDCANLLVSNGETDSVLDDYVLVATRQQWKLSR